MKLPNSSSALGAVSGLTLTCALSAFSAQASTLPSTAVIDDYLIVGMQSKDDNGDAVNVQNTELGANRKMLSDGNSAPNSEQEGAPNTRDVFFQDGDRWKTDSSPTNADDAVQAAEIFEGITYTAEIAITDEDGEISLSNVDVYAEVGVQCQDSAPCDQSVSNSGLYVGDAETRTGDTIATKSNPTNDLPDVSVVEDHTDLLTELSDWYDWVLLQTAEATIASNIENENRKDSSGPFITNITSADANNDGIAIFDIDRGDNDFELNNSDWILDGDGETVAIFRILNGANFNISNSSILMSDAFSPDEGDMNAIFISYEDGTDSSDAVFNFDNVVLNGLGIWDLNKFAGPQDDGAVKVTEIVINNGQGCAQFISEKVTFNDVRWNRCATATHDDVPPIPLPAAGWMLIGGLGILGGMARRRRAKA